VNILRSRRLIILFAVFCFVIQGFGQAGRGSGRLTGKVTDTAGNPIASAKIVLTFIKPVDTEGARRLPGRVKTQASVSFETTTDKEGRWSYLGLGTGIWKITASAKGYHSASRECSVYQLQNNTMIPLRLESVSESKAEDPKETAFLEKANDLFYMKKYDEAILLYEKFLEANPEFDMVALSIGDCYRVKGDLDKAIEQFSLVAEKTSKDPLDKEITARALAGLGECYSKKRDLENARKYFKQSIEKSPESEVTAYNLGEVCFSLRETEDAIRYYALAAQISPYWSDPYYKLGYAYLNKADYEKAKETFQKFLTIEPQGARAAKAKKTLEDIEKIKKLRPVSLSRTHYFLAEVPQTAGDLQVMGFLGRPRLFPFFKIFPGQGRDVGRGR